LQPPPSLPFLPQYHSEMQLRKRLLYRQLAYRDSVLSPLMLSPPSPSRLPTRRCVPIRTNGLPLRNLLLRSRLAWKTESVNRCWRQREFPRHPAEKSHKTRSNGLLLPRYHLKRAALGWRSETSRRLRFPSQHQMEFGKTGPLSSLVLLSGVPTLLQYSLRGQRERRQSRNHRLALHRQTCRSSMTLPRILNRVLRRRRLPGWTQSW